MNATNLDFPNFMSTRLILMLYFSFYQLNTIQLCWTWSWSSQEEFKGSIQGCKGEQALLQFNPLPFLLHVILWIQNWFSWHTSLYYYFFRSSIVVRDKINGVENIITRQNKITKKLFSKSSCAVFNFWRPLPYIALLLQL